MKISGLLQDVLLSALVVATAGVGLAFESRFAHFLAILPFHQPRILAFLNLIGIASVVGLAWAGCYALQWLSRRQRSQA